MSTPTFGRHRQKVMLRSMTGFGRAEGVVRDQPIVVELRSLNSKQLDLVLKVPASVKERENELRALIGERVIRGKVEMHMTNEGSTANKRSTYNTELIQAYHTELKAVRDQIDPAAPTDLFAQVLRLPDVTNSSTERLDEGAWSQLLRSVHTALEAYDAFRISEGGRLGAELAARVAGILELLGRVEEVDGDRIERTRLKLQARLADLKINVDQSRFEQELVFYLEKMDMTEEKVRLRSHCTYFVETMGHHDPQGRKLGFIAQEMGREINTLGSKANDAGIQQLVVRMKDELEKIKEQVLNVL